MYSLTDQQIDFILADLRAQGIVTESLQNDLLDHICILIEQNLKPDGDFEKFYSSLIPSFYKQDLREIEEETTLLLTYKNHWVLSRNQFFLLLFSILVGLTIVYDLLCWWMISMAQYLEKDITGETLNGTLVFALYPFLVFLILWLTPDQLDPLIPQKSTILIGRKPFIKILSSGFLPAGPAATLA